MDVYQLTPINPEQVNFASSSVVDQFGRVFFYQGRVYRAIFSETQAALYAGILQAPWVADLIEAGLIDTAIATDVALKGAFLTLSHETLPYETHPAENTNLMHWLAAKTMVRVGLELAHHGLALKDAHPWNIMFKKGQACFIDFSSIVAAPHVYPTWLSEFRQYFCVPIWLASTRWHAYALEYRRQHCVGFGLKLFGEKWLSKLLFYELNRLQKHLHQPIEFFLKLDRWLNSHKPARVTSERWSEYQQSGTGTGVTRAMQIKQQFVSGVLSTESPAKVMDLAANKGHFSEIAARRGAAVVACDYEEHCVDACLHRAQQMKLAITPVLMDFNRPTPNFGLALLGQSAFQRLNSDIVLALGLVHHICIAQKVPVEVFCMICMAYANHGIVIEYVDPADKHVQSWGLPVPEHYSLDGFTRFFRSHFPNVTFSEPMLDYGINRTMAYFSK